MRPRRLLAILRMTLVAGADLESTNRHGGKALIPAAQYGHPEIARWLVAHGAGMQRADAQGVTLLPHAEHAEKGGQRGQRTIVENLQRAGARP